jgi:epsilon-lactone hydrolase
MPITDDQRTQELAALNAMLAPLLAPREPPLTLDERRAAYDGWGGSYPLADGVGITRTQLDGVPALTATPADPAQGAALLYLHGGGYCIGSATSHQHLVAQFAAASGLEAHALDYRLGPEHPFPAAVEDAVAAYQALLASGIPADGIVIAGDSAGGGLTVATALALKQRGIALPAGLFCISPWANLEQTGASYGAMSNADPVVAKQALDQWASLYLGGADPAQPLASPVHGDLAGLPPLLIHVGSEEVLLSDSILLAERAGLARVPVELVIAPRMLHVWHYMWAHLTDAREAIAAAGAWIAARTARQAGAH